LFDVLVCSNQLHGQGLDIAFELLNELGLRVIILDGPISDEGCLGCISERHVIFLKKLVTWVQTRDHQAGRISTQTLSKQACELAITIRDVDFLPASSRTCLLCLLRQRLNDFSEREKTLINLN